VVPTHDGVLPNLLDSLYRLRERRSAPVDGSNLDAHHDRESIVDAHAVEFSKTAVPLWGGHPRRRPFRPYAQGRSEGRPRSIALRTNRGKHVACRGDPKSERCIEQHRGRRGRNARSRARQLAGSGGGPRLMLESVQTAISPASIRRALRGRIASWVRAPGAGTSAREDQALPACCAIRTRPAGS
jgi:hypothetical protein